jgi:hypothetical protein
MENLLAEKELDPAIELAVREELHALAELDPDKIGGDEETKAWERVKKWAPDLLQTGQAIVVTVASERTKKHLGL